MDIHVTSSLPHIIRLAQAGPKVSYSLCGGPKDQNMLRGGHVAMLALPHPSSQIASRYITDPVLFLMPEAGLVKFDIRYIILLKSVVPAEA